MRTIPDNAPASLRLCRGCDEPFIGQRAFDMHQWDDGRTPACKPKSTYRKRLHWSEAKGGWRQRQPA